MVHSILAHRAEFTDSVTGFSFIFLVLLFYSYLSALESVKESCM